MDWATKDGFKSMGWEGKEIVKLLQLGFRLGSWSDATGVISCRDWRWLKVLRNRFMASCNIGLANSLDFKGGRGGSTTDGSQTPFFREKGLRRQCHHAFACPVERLQ